MVVKKSSDIINDFRKSRGQSTERTLNNKGVSKNTGKNSNKNTYDYFLMKYNNLEKFIDTFGVRDLIFFFKETAKEGGYNYFISNIQKDMGIMKKLKTGYSNREICGMIEFLFLSEQNYLDKKRLSVGILVSSWVNTIYADTMLWVEDNYKPNKKNKKQLKGEWNNHSEDDTSLIGGFL